MSDATGGTRGTDDDAPDHDGPGARLALFTWPGLAVMGGAIALGTWYGQAGVVLLASLVAATGLVARAWAWASLTGLSYERRLSAQRCFPGDTVRLEARLDNRKILPLSWVEAEERLPAALAPDNPLVGPADAEGRRSLRFSTPLGWYRAATLTRDLPCRRRGYHRVGPARVFSSDVFGLFVKDRQAAPADILVVYPRLYAMADLGLPARQPLGATRDLKRLFDDPSRPMGLRPYTPETPFKAIAWKATARSGEMQAKLYDPTVTLDTAIFLAVDSFTEADGEDVFELAVSTVASLADHDLSARRPVGVFANGLQADGGGAVIVPPGRAPDQKTLVLERLARLTREPAGDFTAFLDAELAGSAGRATLAVVGARFPVPVLERLQEIHRRGRPVVLLVAGDAALPREGIPALRVGGLLNPVAA